MPRRAKSPTQGRRLVIYTIGHSTHSIDTFLELLTRHRIATLADVRSYPSSRRWPHFNQDQLKVSVESLGMAYRWFKALGGRRHSKLAHSPHNGWELAAFRSYADYADSDEFGAALLELSEAAARTPTAFMCSEGLWWRCHRRIISDHLVVAGWEVRHIMPDGKLAAHPLTEFARVMDGRLIYDGGQPRLNLK